MIQAVDINISQVPTINVMYCSSDSVEALQRKCQSATIQGVICMEASRYSVSSSFSFMSQTSCGKVFQILVL